MKSFFSNRVVIKTGNIINETVDALVNAANSSLLGGGGVDGAIHQAGGPQIVEECRIIRKTKYPDGLPTGEAVITKAGHLRAKYIIHTVGPIYGEKQENQVEQLKKCYLNSLNLARENHLKSIAFPSISTGAYGYPKEKAAKITAQIIQKYVFEFSVPEIILLVFFSQKDMEIFLKYSEWE